VEWRSERRSPERLAQAEGSPELTRGLLTRRERFVEPDAESLSKPEPRRHAAESMTGLLANREPQTGAGIASLRDQERQGRQKFRGHTPWNHHSRRVMLARQVGDPGGEPDAGIGFDPAAFPKKGTKSVGVARQGGGRLGKVENCQVGVSRAERSRKGHAIVQVRRSLPAAGAKARPSRRGTGLPKTIPSAPVTTWRGRSWPSAENAGRRPGSQAMTSWAEPRVFAGKGGPSAQGIGWGCPRPPGSATSTAPFRNRREADDAPRVPSGQGTPGVQRCRKGLAWTKFDVRDGEKRPLVIEAVKRRVRAWKESGGVGPDKVLLLT
jgi:hypothetical protein